MKYVFLLASVLLLLGCDHIDAAFDPYDRGVKIRNEFILAAQDR